MVYTQTDYIGVVLDRSGHKQSPCTVVDLPNQSPTLRPAPEFLMHSISSCRDGCLFMEGAT